MSNKPVLRITEKKHWEKHERFRKKSPQNEKLCNPIIYRQLKRLSDNTKHRCSISEEEEEEKREQRTRM